MVKLGSFPNYDPPVLEIIPNSKIVFWDIFKYIYDHEELFENFLDLSPFTMFN